jgi:hypothetical protein
MHAVLEASAILHERVVHLVSLVDPCDRRQGTVHDRFHSKRLSSFESNSSGHAYRAPEKETEMEHGYQRERDNARLSSVLVLEDVSCAKAESMGEYSSLGTRDLMEF